MSDWRIRAEQTGEIEAVVFGGPSQPIGWWVARNVFSEASLADRDLELLLGLLSADQPFGTDFDVAVQRLRFAARTAVRPTPEVKLRRLIPARRVLQAAADIGMIPHPGGTDEQAEWDYFADVWVDSDDTRRGQLLAKISLSFELNPICWAFVADTTFDPSATKSNISRLYDRLALNWRTVESYRKAPRPGLNLPLAVLLEYDWENISNARIPTVLDAGWNARFAPAAPGRGLGRTVDRRGASSDPTSTGLDEIVHDNRDLMCIDVYSLAESIATIIE